METIVVVGSINMDLVTKTPRAPELGETILGIGFEQIPGGKGANQAVAMARLGADVHLIGRVGNDDIGIALINAMKEAHVNVENVLITQDVSTGIATITVDQNGDNSIIVVQGANAMVSIEDIEKNAETICSAKILVTQLEIPLPAVEKALCIAKEAGVLTVLNPAPATQLSDEMLRNVDMITPNETEIAILTGVSGTDEKSLLQAAGILIERGVGSVVITLGAQGARYFSKEKQFHRKAFPTHSVDSTAAGDSFTGALCVALTEGKGIEEAMGFAAKVGAITVSRSGAQSSLPMRKEVDERMDIIE